MHESCAERLRVLLVDDSPAFLGAARRYLETQPWAEVVGHARDGAEAVTQSEALRPDLVLMDMVMPGMNGTEATRRICGLPRAPRVIVMSLHDNDEYRRGAVESGADAFLAKSDLVAGLKALLDRFFGTGAVRGPKP